MSIDLLLQNPEFSSESQGAVFSEPWQAKAFAIVVQLAENNVFEWKDWVDSFSAEVAKSEQKGYQPETDYYPCWVRALEKLLASNSLLDDQTVAKAVNDTLANWPHPDHIAQSEPVHISPPLD